MTYTSHINELFNSISYRQSGLLVDAGDFWEGFYNVRTLLLTHAHFDHIYGLRTLLTLNPDIAILTNSFGREMLLNPKLNLSWYHGKPFSINDTSNVVLVQDGQEIIYDHGLMVKAYFTPGHNPSCITWSVGHNLYTGDSYIPDVRTVTNLPGGNREEARKSEERILRLAESRQILAGHKVNCGKYET